MSQGPRRSRLSSREGGGVSTIPNERVRALIERADRFFYNEGTGADSDVATALRELLTRRDAEAQLVERAAAWGYEQGAQRFIGDPEDLAATARFVAKEVHAALAPPPPSATKGEA